MHHLTRSFICLVPPSGKQIIQTLAAFLLGLPGLTRLSGRPLFLSACAKRFSSVHLADRCSLVNLPVCATLNFRRVSSENILRFDAGFIRALTSSLSFLPLAFCEIFLLVSSDRGRPVLC